MNEFTQRSLVRLCTHHRNHRAHTCPFFLKETTNQTIDDSPLTLLQISLRKNSIHLHRSPFVRTALDFQ